MEANIKERLEAAYNSFEDSEMMERYLDRHGIESAGILTVYNDEMADLIASYLEPRIAGKTVIEIGGGIGLLAMHIGLVAKKVYCIEASPIWTSCFLVSLMQNKPKNVSYLFGSADEFAGQIRGDVAVICTHSGLESMKKEAAKFAPEVIDVYGELVAQSPKSFDRTAQVLRAHT